MGIGIWKEIGKALNSTIKTAKCVPLNELIVEKAIDTESVINRLNVPVSAQLVSSYTADTSATAISASGKGFADVHVYTNNDNAAQLVKVTVDGIVVVNNANISTCFSPDIVINGVNNYHYHVQVRFKKSISIWIDGKDISNKTYAKGIVYFEE